jgi:ferric-dicitrate binding protein FerR (iron transport regulator)/outer membrane protein assembly factor BamD (BamD/ComL family)
MMTVNRDDRTQRALAELKSAYDGTALPDAAKCRIVDAVFAPPPRRPRTLRLAVALGATAAIAAVVALWGFSSDRDAGSSGAPTAIRLVAVVQEIKGRVEVTSPRREAPALAALRMRLDAGSAIATGPNSAAVVRVGRHEVTIIGDTRLDLAAIDSAGLRFGVDRGRARFDVARLAPGERFTVIADGLTVEVVGTRFDVYFDGACPAVAVEEGRVRTSFRAAAAIVAAGASRRFCAPTGAALASPATEQPANVPLGTDAAAPSPHPARTGADAAEIAAPIASSTSAAETGTAAGAPQSEEERLYLEALAARVRGDLPLAVAQMAEYLERYPDGAFAEEALFSLVRIEYRRRAFAEVQRRGASYLERYRGRDAKADEVRILYAESLHRLGAELVIVVELLAPLVAEVDSIASPYREQALYLYFATAASIGRAADAKRIAATYLERYPEGRYAVPAKALLEEK